MIFGRKARERVHQRDKQGHPRALILRRRRESRDSGCLLALGFHQFHVGHDIRDIVVPVGLMLYGNGAVKSDFFQRLKRL